MIIEDFNGWETPQANDEDFFTSLGEEDDNDALSLIKKEVEETVVPKDPIKEEKEEEEDFFLSVMDNIDSEKDNKETSEQKSTNSIGDIAVLNAMKDKGFLNYELKDGETLTEELAQDLLKESFNTKVDELISTKLSSLPQDAKNLIQYTLSGGNLGDYISQVYTGQTFNISEGLDIDKEEVQISVLKSMMKEEGDSDNIIETNIELLKNSGKLASYSKERYNKWLEDRENSKQEAVKIASEKRIQEENRIRDNKNKLSEFLRGKPDVSGVTLSSEDRQNLPSFIEDKTVEMSNGVRISQMQYDLIYDIPKNQVAMLQLAALLKNRKEDGSFDFTQFQRNAQTGVVKEIRKELRNQQDSAIVDLEKNLADYF